MARTEPLGAGPAQGMARPPVDGWLIKLGDCRSTATVAARPAAASAGEGQTPLLHGVDDDPARGSRRATGYRRPSDVPVVAGELAPTGERGRQLRMSRAAGWAAAGAELLPVCEWWIDRSGVASASGPLMSSSRSGSISVRRHGGVGAVGSCGGSVDAEGSPYRGEPEIECPSGTGA